MEIRENKMWWALFWLTVILMQGLASTTPRLNLTFYEPMGEHQRDYEIYIGQKSIYKLTLDVANQSMENVVLEVVTGDVANFILGVEPFLSIGENVNATIMHEGIPVKVTDSTYYYFMERMYGGEYSDPELAIRHETGFLLKLGNVSALDKNESTTIEITLEFYYLTYSEYEDNFCSTVMVEYFLHGKKKYTISQVEYTLKPTSLPISAEESIDIETVPDPVKGLPRIRLLLNLPSVKNKLQVEVAVKNADLYKNMVVVSEIKMVFVGTSFKSVDASKIFTSGHSECPLATSLALDCGVLFNKAASEDAPNSGLNLVKIEAVIQAIDTKLNGTEITVVIGIYLGEKKHAWSGEVNLPVNIRTRSQLKFSTFITSVRPEYKTVSPGFPGVIEITLIIPEFTSYNYSFSFITSSMKGESNALSILGMSLNSAGNNIDCNTRDSSTITLDLTESIPGSKLYNRGSVTLTITNINIESKPTDESNQIKFNLYVMMLTNAMKGDIHRLLVDVNDVGWQPEDFTVGNGRSYIMSSLYKDDFKNDCPSKTFYPGTTISYRVDVTTLRNTCVGPVTYRTALPSLNLHMLELISADIVFRGRNVGCVNAGKIYSEVVEWVDTDSEVGGTFLYLPLVCNIEVVDNPTEDHFVIELKLNILNLEELPASDFDNHVFVTHRDTIYNRTSFEDRFNTKNPIDFGQSKRVIKMTIPFSMLKYIDVDNFAYKLQWSVNNVEFNNPNQNWVKGEIVSDELMFNADRPLYARYVRLVSENSGCTVQFKPIRQDFAKYIDFYGAAFSKNKMMENVMYELDDDDSTCKQLPFKSSTETVTYYWSHYETQILNADGATKFKVKIIGRGIECDNKLGPQITKVMFPKNSKTKKFGGVWNKCKFQERIDGNPMSCMYQCECSGVTTCASISVLFLYIGIPTEPYELCSIKVIQ